MEINNAEDLWERIKILSNRKNVLQKDWCEALGFDVQNIRNKIYRKAFPTIEEIVQISKYFEVSIDYLITGNTADSTERVIDLESRLKQISELSNI
jgi:transcriptional regulator with XRE-family HTH domain